jgi:hypothetical protein
MSLGRISAVSVVDTTVLALEWDDGARSRVDLSAVIANHKAVASLAAAKEFSKVNISADGKGTWVVPPNNRILSLW